MATLASVQIADRDSSFDSGAAYLLAQKCDVTNIITISTNREVEIRKGNPYIVARVKDAANPTNAFNVAYETVQQALDLLSVQGKTHLSTRNASDEYLTWWREPTGQVLRVVSVINLPMTTNMPNVVVTDKEGNVIPQLSPPDIIYHESFRYFRLAQVTDNLFDAFRNMYLAFELILEHITPRENYEKEGKWIKRALKEVDNQIQLTKVYRPTTSNVVDDIYKQIYIDIRCAIFHSKKNERLIPQNLSDRRKVGKGLMKLSRLVLLIAEKWFHARHPKGGITYAGFNMMTKPLLDNSIILVSDSDDPLDRAETLEGNTFRNAVEMKTNSAPELSEPGLNFMLGTIDAADLQSLKKIARFGVKQNNDLIMVATIDAEMKYDGIDRLEAQLGIQLRNVRRPKFLYMT